MPGQYRGEADAASHSSGVTEKALSLPRTADNSIPHPGQRFPSDVQNSQCESPTVHRWSAYQSRKISRSPFVTQMPRSQKPRKAGIDQKTQKVIAGRLASHFSDDLGQSRLSHQPPGRAQRGGSLSFPISDSPAQRPIGQSGTAMSKTNSPTGVRPPRARNTGGISAANPYSSNATAMQARKAIAARRKAKPARAVLMPRILTTAEAGGEHIWV